MEKFTDKAKRLTHQSQCLTSLRQLPNFLPEDLSAVGKSLGISRVTFSSGSALGSTQEGFNETHSFESLGVVTQRGVENTTFAVLNHHQHWLIPTRFFQIGRITRSRKHSYIFRRSAKMRVTLVFCMQPEIWQALGDRILLVADGHHKLILCTELSTIAFHWILVDNRWKNILYR
jgi:hypothetical protein